MRRRPRPPSAPPRVSVRRAVLAAGVAGALVLGAACEPDADTASTDPGAGSPEPTTSTARPEGTKADPGVRGDRAGGDEPPDPTSDSRPGPTDVVTGGTEVSLPGSGTRGGSIRAVDFADLTYPTSVCADVIDRPPSGGYELVDGEAHADEDAADGPYRVELRPSRSFGDVNQDGHEDAALVLECSRGGQPVPTGWIYTRDDSGPRPLAGVDLDPDALPITGVLDTSLTNVRITGATVVTDWDVYVDGDALCCASKSAVVVWTWTDGGLVPGAPTLTRTTSG